MRFRSPHTHTGIQTYTRLVVVHMQRTKVCNTQLSLIAANNIAQKQQKSLQYSAQSFLSARHYSYSLNNAQQY